MTTDLTYRFDYYSETPAGSGLRRFANEIFGLDFNRVHQYGIAFPNYTPFSFFQNDRVVANISVTSLDLIITGREVRAGQIGTLGVIPEYRGKGLIRELFKKAHDYCDKTFEMLFLFANTSVLNFYQQFGYRKILEHSFSTRPLNSAGVSTLRKLNLDNKDDFNLITRLAQKRTPISRICGALKYEWLTMFHLIYSYPNHLYYIPELDLLLVYHAKGPATLLVDIIGSQMPAFEHLASFLDLEQSQTIEFGFTPDLLNIKTSAHPETLAAPKNAQLFVRGKFPLENEIFKFPITLHT